MPVREFDLSSIENKIDSTAFTLFREWIKGVKKIFPEYDFTIKDESVIPVDLACSIKQALNSIVEDKTDKFMLWKIGYFYGFTGSNLNLHWYREYITKRNQEYKTIILLQSINKFLMQDESSLNKIIKLYNSSIEKELNLAYYEPDIYVSKAAIVDQMTIPMLTRIKGIYNNPVFTCLDNIITEMINSFTNKEEKNFLPDLKDYFTDAELENLIKANT